MRLGLVLSFAVVATISVLAQEKTSAPTAADLVKAFKAKLGLTVDPTELTSTAPTRPLSMSESYLVSIEPFFNIKSRDGTPLCAGAIVPLRWICTDETFPIVIFPNSWGLPYIEYSTRALAIAARGYIVVQYQTRGFWLSGGQVDTAGPNDEMDGSSVIDYVLSRADWHPRADKIAFAGISYGAGISLMVGGSDPRVTTVIPMSGWSNLTEMGYGRQSPNKMIDLLMSMASPPIGRPSPQLTQMASDVINHVNMGSATDYSNRRSPARYLPSMNQRRLPVLVVHNYWDELFRSQTMLPFFKQLTGPKKMILNEGSHAIPEGKGLFAQSYVWDRVQDWLDCWLKGVQNPNGIMQLPEIQAQLGPTTGIASPHYLPFSDWEHSTVTLYSGARQANTNSAGPLSPTAPSTGTLSETPIHFSTTPGFDAGMAGELGMDGGKPYMVTLAQDPTTSVVWQSAPFAAAFNLCGTPTFNLHFKASQDTWQVFTTLYDVAPGATEGSLLSHGFFSWYPDGPVALGGAPIHNADGSWSIKDVELHTMCRPIAAGHSVALALVLLHADAFYPANSSPDLTVTVLYGAGTSVTLPVLTQP